MANKYYQKHKEGHQKNAGERYQYFSEEEKDKRRKRSKTNTKIFLKNKNLKFLLLQKICFEFFI